MDQWYFRVVEWIIQDANYPDFYLDQVVSFGLRLIGRNLALIPSNSQTISAILLEDYDYAVNGKIIYIGDKLSVIDIGLRCVVGTSALAKDCRVGDMVEGTGILDLDAYTVNNARFLDPLPAIIYKWNIYKIIKQCSPVIVTPPPNGKGPTVITNDPDRSKIVRTSISKTAASNLEVGCSYILEGARVEFTPDVWKKLMLNPG